MNENQIAIGSPHDASRNPTYSDSLKILAELQPLFPAAGMAKLVQTAGEIIRCDRDFSLRRTGQSRFFIFAAVFFLAFLYFAIGPSPSILFAFTMLILTVFSLIIASHYLGTSIASLAKIVQLPKQLINIKGDDSNE